jgi:hypothetical protein
MVRINNSCLRALEGGMEQALLNYLRIRAQWKKGPRCAVLQECCINTKKRDWQNGTMVGCTAVIRGNRVEDLYSYVQVDYDRREEFDLLAKEDLIRRLNGIIDVERRRKDWELFTGIKK